MNHDGEMAAWRRNWQADPDTTVWAPGLKERVMRQNRRHKIGLVLPVLVTVVVGGWLLIAAASGKRADVVSAVEGWLFIASLWATCLWVARGTWQPLGESTAAFADLAIHRCRTNLLGARLGLWFYAGQLALSSFLQWIADRSATGLTELLTSWSMILLGWIGLPAFIGWMVWYQRRQRAELARLLELKRQLGDADASA